MENILFMHALATFKKENFNIIVWVICGSHPDCSVGQWVKWINRCDPLSTLVCAGVCVCMCVCVCVCVVHVSAPKGMIWCA